MTLLQQSTVKNKKSYSVSGYLGGPGSYIAYTGTVTANIANVAGVPYSGSYNAYFGALAGITALDGATTWSNPVLQALGAPYSDVGLGVWAAQLNTTATETIAYSFTSAVPAGSSFLLVDPGVSYPEYTGSFTYTISATYKGAAVSLAGWTITATSPTGGVVSGTTVSTNVAAGTVTVTSYAGTTWPDLIIVITPNTPITGLSVSAATIPYDFWALTLPHEPSPILLSNGNAAPAYSGDVLCWQFNGTTVTGGGPIAAPGAAWTIVGTGDFQGNGATDILFVNQSGLLAYWAISGTTIVGGATIGGPLGTWKVVGTGDFNGDGLSDIVFEDMTGDLAVWEMNGGSITGGGEFGAMSQGAVYLGLGDFNGDGDSDVLSETAAGVLQEWQMKGASVAKVVTLGAAPAGFVYAGIGDFNGDGRADVLLKNPATGTYEAWLMAADGSVQSTATLCTPGVNETLVSIGAFTASAASDLVFENTLNSSLDAYLINAASLTGVSHIGSLGASYWVVDPPDALPPPPTPTIYFSDASGDLAFWTTPHGAVSGSGVLAGSLSGLTFLAAGDFYGYGRPDFLARDASGNFNVYDISAGQIVASGNIGSPDSSWSYRGVGDFNGDGITDILLQNTSGAYSEWLLNGATAIDTGGALGNPGASYTLAGVGDFTGDGTSDLLFETSAGSYLAWFVANGAYAGSAFVGVPEPTWTLLGTGDFNGDGKADLLFQTGSNAYSTWDLNGGSVVGGGSFAGPGAGWSFFAIADLNSNGCASVLFRDAATGGLIADNMNDFTVVASVAVGSSGATYTPIAAI